MPFLFVIEIAFQLPVSLYSLRRLGRGGGEGTSGPYELLLLVYAFETAFSTMLCINHTAYLDPADFTTAQRDVFWYQLMGPWIAFRKCLPVPSRDLVGGPEVVHADSLLSVAKNSLVDVCGYVLETVPTCFSSRCGSDQEEPIGRTYGATSCWEGILLDLWYLVTPGPSRCQSNLCPKNKKRRETNKPALVYTRTAD